MENPGYYYQRNGETVGPVAFSYLKAALQNEWIDGSTLVRADESAKWKPLKKQPFYPQLKAREEESMDRQVAREMRGSIRGDGLKSMLIGILLMPLGGLLFLVGGIYMMGAGVFLGGLGAYKFLNGIWQLVTGAT